MKPQTYRMRIDGELVTLEERQDQTRVKIGRVTIYGATPLIAMQGVVELLSPERAA